MTDIDLPFQSQVVRHFESLDLEQLDALAATLCKHLAPPAVIGLVGTLGAGKTTFVQAISRAANIDSAEVTSPTFTLLQTHVGDFKIHHLDTYRLADEDEFLQLGVDELMEDTDAWTIIEWADRMPSVMPPDVVWIRFQLTSDDDRRQVTIHCNDPVKSESLKKAAKDLTFSV